MKFKSNIHKTFIFVVLNLLLLTINSNAMKVESIGIGLASVDNTPCITTNLWLNEENTMDFNVSPQYLSADIHWYDFRMMNSDKLLLHYGGGVFKNTKNNTNNSGIRALTGLTYLFKQNNLFHTPFDIFIETAFNLDSNNNNNLLYFNDSHLSINAGFRLYFATVPKPTLKKKEKPIYKTLNKNKSEDYEITVKTMDEIPISVYYLLQKQGGAIVNLKIRNTATENQKFVVAYNIGSKKLNEIKEVTVKSNETMELNLVPMLTLEEIKKAVNLPTQSNIYVGIDKYVDSKNTDPVYRNFNNIDLLPYDQYSPVVTDAIGNKYDTLDTLVYWVTYSDRSLSKVIKKASDKGSKQKPSVKIVGFQTPEIFTRYNQDKRTLKERDVDYLAQIKLIYDTLKEDYHITYLNQPVVYKQTQRIKLPSQTLEESGNCIELAVLFASLLESIEIEPIIVLNKEDGHAAVGWKVPSDEKPVYHLLETNMFGESFSKVLTRGEKLMEEYKLSDDFTNGISFNEKGIFTKSTGLYIYDVKKIRKNIPPCPYFGD